MAVTHTVIGSPIGDITLVGDGGTLVGLYFSGHWPRPDRSGFGPRGDDGFDDAIAQLAQYFAGERVTFDLPVDAKGDTFQRRVWALIEQIPYGQTSTYGELARQLGNASLARDVGVAVGSNPLCVIVPCHRVLGRNGSLTGYAGGLKRKRHLLDLEESMAGCGLRPGQSRSPS